MNCRAVLEIGGCEYELLRFKYSFSVDTDRKGRPKSAMRGGSFYFQVESTDENILLQILLRKKRGYFITGNIRLFQEFDDKTIRTISFEAYMFSVGENAQIYPSAPMITTFAFSAMKLNFNDRVCIDRRLPETAGFGWEKYKEAEKKSPKIRAKSPATQVALQSEPKAKEEEKSTPLILEAYWLDNDKKRQDLDIGFPVKLHIRVDNCKQGESIDFTFEDNHNGIVEKITRSGVVGENNIVILDNFKFSNNSDVDDTDS